MQTVPLPIDRVRTKAHLLFAKVQRESFPPLHEYRKDPFPLTRASTVRMPFIVICTGRARILSRLLVACVNAEEP